jgi:hypothetical protein
VLRGVTCIVMLIEKGSPYHQQHDGKSYFPWKLNRWFRAQGLARLIREEQPGQRERSAGAPGTNSNTLTPSNIPNSRTVWLPPAAFASQSRVP